jgi:hypothetical protein
VNRRDREEVERYVSGGDPEFYDEDYSDDDVIDPIELTSAQLAEIDAFMALIPAEVAPPTFYEEI